MEHTSRRSRDGDASFDEPEVLARVRTKIGGAPAHVRLRWLRLLRPASDRTKALEFAVGVLELDKALTLHEAWTAACEARRRPQVPARGTRDLRWEAATLAIHGPSPRKKCAAQFRRRRTTPIRVPARRGGTHTRRSVRSTGGRRSDDSPGSSGAGEPDPAPGGPHRSVGACDVSSCARIPAGSGLTRSALDAPQADLLGRSVEPTGRSTETVARGRRRPDEPESMHLVSSVAAARPTS
jgi:hypothetical protein